MEDGGVSTEPAEGRQHATECILFQAHASISPWLHHWSGTAQHRHFAHRHRDALATRRPPRRTIEPAHDRALRLFRLAAEPCIVIGPRRQPLAAPGWRTWEGSR